MGKTALLFPGQGSQSPGMGAELAKDFASARAVFEQADEALGFSLSKLCFEGPAEELALTENTQPAILTTSVAVLAAAREKRLEGDYVAGHSLGEYSALVAAGSIDFTDAVKLVRNRGRYMQEAVPTGVGAMAAILGLSGEVVNEVCEQAAQGQVVSPANLNSPGQVVIAGHTEAVERVAEAAKEAGARKAIMLNVSAPFHCALMEPARDRLTPELDAIEFRDLETPLVNNADANELSSGEAAREGLKKQIPNPVLWEMSVRRLVELGVDRFIEVGSGRVLTGLLRNIDRSFKGVAVGDRASLEKL